LRFFHEANLPSSRAKSRDPSPYPKGFRTDSLEPEPVWRFARDDISLKRTGGPDVFPHSPSGPRRILLHHVICSHPQTLCCTVFSQAGTFFSLSSRRGLTVHTSV